MELLKYSLRIDTKKQIVLMLLIIIAVTLEFFNVSLEGKIIDNAIKNGNSGLLIKYILIYFIVILLSNGIAYITGVLFSQVSQKTLIKIRTDLYNHILRLNIDFFHNNSPGEIMSRIIPEVQQLGTVISQLIPVPLYSIIIIVAGLGLILQIEWKLGIVAFGIFGLVFLFLPKLRYRLRGTTKKWSENIRNISKQTVETISHYLEIQCHNTFFYEEKLFQKSLYDFFKINIDLAKISGKTSFLTKFFSAMATLSVYSIGGWLVIKHMGEPDGLTVGSIFVMIRALSIIISPVSTLIDFSQKYQEALVKFNMVSDYMDIPGEMIDRKDAKEIKKFTGKISINNLSFWLEPSCKILKNINLEIKEGEHLALVGPAGCGKSTLMLLINRMMKPEEGEIKFDDLNMLDIKISSIRKKIGYVPQAKSSTPLLFGGTLVDNIIYSLRSREENPLDESIGWFDLETIGIKNLDDLQEEVINILKDINFYDDVFNFGLSKVTLIDALKYTESIFKIRDPVAIRREVLKGRQTLREKLTKQYEDLIEFFEESKFINQASIMENIIFTSVEPFIKDLKAYETLEKVMASVCKKAGIYNNIFETGYKVIKDLTEMFREVKMEGDLIKKFHISAIDIKKIMDIEENLSHSTIDKLNMDSPEGKEIFKAGYSYSLAMGLDFYIDEDFKKKILEARKIFKQEITPELKGKIKFYDENEYVDGSTIRENLIMGKINTSYHKAEEKIDMIIKEVIKESQLEDEIISLGLLMDIGERGGRLSGGQAQKAVMARILLKKPDILLLDEATSALDNESQQQVTSMLSAGFKDKTVITIAHRLNIVKNYDKIVVLKSGKIMEEGNFNNLMEKKGLFFELWEKSIT